MKLHISRSLKQARHRETNTARLAYMGNLKWSYSGKQREEWTRELGINGYKVSLLPGA